MLPIKKKKKKKIEYIICKTYNGSFNQCFSGHVNKLEKRDCEVHLPNDNIACLKKIWKYHSVNKEVRKGDKIVSLKKKKKQVLFLPFP